MCVTHLLLKFNLLKVQRWRRAGTLESLNSSWEIRSDHMCKLNYSLHYCRLQPYLISLFQLYSFFSLHVILIFKTKGEF